MGLASSLSLPLYTHSAEEKHSVRGRRNGCRPEKDISAL
jgi:hypothetical protein